MDSRYKRLGKNTALVFIGSAGSKIIGFLMLPFYTHYLSTEEYGVSSLITTYSSISVAIFTCCIADAIFIFPKNADREGRKKYFSSGIAFLACTFTLCAIVFGILNLCGKTFDWRGTFFEMTWWLYAFAISEYFQRYSQQFCMSIDEMKVYVISGVVQTLALALLALVLLPKFGLSGYLWSIVGANFIAGLYTLITSGEWRYASLDSFSKPHLKELLSYGIPLIPNGLMWWLVNGVNRPIMEQTLGLAAIGIYAVAGKFPSLLNMLFMIFSNAWGISMLEEFHKPDFNAFFNKTVKALYFVIIIGGCIITLCSKELIRIFAAPEYFEAWRYVPLLTLSIILQCLSSLVGGVFSAEKKSKYFFYSSIWGAVVSVALTWPLIKLYNIAGVAMAVALSFLCMTIVRLKYAWKHINMFDSKYFILVMLIYIAYIYVNYMDLSFYVELVAFSITIGLILLMSKKEINAIIIRLKKRK